MGYAISIPQFYADGEFDPDAFRARMQRIEELGFDSAWAQEQVLTMAQMPQLGAIETMTFAAAATSRIRVGCSVFVSSLHNPVHLARSLSTLDQLSRGRLDVGVGYGGKGRMLSAFGIEAEGLLTRFTEGVEVMRALWSEPSVSFEGRFWQLQGARMEPKPFQKPGPPVWFGGGHAKALRRAARLGDGFFGAGSTTTEAFAEQVRTLRTEVAAAGRDPETYPIAKRVYVVIDDDAARARALVEQNLEKLYGSPAFAPVAVAGTPSDVVAGVRSVIDAGAELVLFTPMVEDPEQAERIAAEVIPQLG
ncbi:LLM class flavin-dependent oxidoreductase [Nocardia sp. NEAU-G5]|uniref:LLM class flavin-dependent oxidoreductase n=1 Tax=Nocardia albiluteola TaxID=2842303 RepID=A0ABS6B331_9NOCA|nr:LLM class flavin-dependent oxidoreductase [Nocardia albiluteola]MBU3064644.1 LLM class flavin-dependent oxidoreductase [Nocardia albiluteola]